MEIIKAGEPQGKYYNFNCPHCFCLVGASHDELTWKPYFQNNEYCELDCPQCGKHITGGSRNQVGRQTPPHTNA